MKNMETNRNLKWIIKEILRTTQKGTEILRTLYLELVSAAAGDVNYRQVRLACDLRLCTQRGKTLQETIPLRTKVNRR